MKSINNYITEKFRITNNYKKPETTWDVESIKKMLKCFIPKIKFARTENSLDRLSIKTGCYIEDNESINTIQCQIKIANRAYINLDVYYVSKQFKVTQYNAGGLTKMLKQICAKCEQDGVNFWKQYDSILVKSPYDYLENIIKEIAEYYKNEL